MARSKTLHIHLLFHTLPATIVPVADYAAASKAMRELVDKHGLGSSDMRKGCGDVKDATGNKVYRVSYNGRCWVGTECVFDGGVPEYHFKKRADYAQ